TVNCVLIASISPIVTCLTPFCVLPPIILHFASDSNRRSQKPSENSVFSQRSAVYGPGSGRRENLCYPECVPHALRSEKPAEQEGRRNNYRYITAQGDHQGGGALSQAFQSAGGSNRHGGDNKARADEPQGQSSLPNSLRAVGKQSHEMFRHRQADHGSQGHNQEVHNQRGPVNTPHPFVL